MWIFFYFLQEIDKLKKRLAEAEAAQQANKKPEEKAQSKVPPGGALHEWVCAVALIDL